MFCVSDQKRILCSDNDLKILLSKGLVCNCWQTFIAARAYPKNSFFFVIEFFLWWCPFEAGKQFCFLWQRRKNFRYPTDDNRHATLNSKLANFQSCNAICRYPRSTSILANVPETLSFLDCSVVTRRWEFVDEVPIWNFLSNEFNAFKRKVLLQPGVAMKPKPFWTLFQAKCVKSFFIPCWNWMCSSARSSQTYKIGPTYILVKSDWGGIILCSVNCINLLVWLLDCHSQERMKFFN